MSDFGSFNLSTHLVKALRESNILVPTNLQKSAIPEIQKGKDVVIDARPGSSRTLAFALPVVGRILDTEYRSRTVILTSSQETSFEIDSDIRRIARSTDMRILAVSAGIETTRATYDFFTRDEDFPHILIGQPPTINHFIAGTGYDLSRVDHLLVVSDEETCSREFEDMALDIGAKVRTGCRRILVTSNLDRLSDRLIESLLRSPSIIHDSSKTHPEKEQGEKEGPSLETIDNRLYMSLEPLTQDDFTSIIRMEWERRSLVIVNDPDEAAGLRQILKSEIKDAPVFLLRDFDTSKPVPSRIILVSDPAAAFKHKDVLFNVVILRSLPGNYENYVRLLGLLKCERGDKIVSIGAPRDIHTLYNIRTAYGIKMKEMLLPTSRQLQAEKEAEIIHGLARSAGEPDEKTLSLLRRIQASPFEEKILAESLRRMVGETSREGEGREAAPYAPPPPQQDRQQRKRRQQPQQDRPQKQHEEPGRQQDRRSEPPSRPSRPPQAARSEPTGKPRSPKPKHQAQHMVELRLNAGRNDGLEAGFLIQWLQSRLAMRSSEFGPVYVHEDSSTIHVPQARADDAATMLNGLRFGGKVIEVKAENSREGKKR